MSPDFKFEQQFLRHKKIRKIKLQGNLRKTLVFIFCRHLTLSEKLKKVNFLEFSDREI